MGKKPKSSRKGKKAWRANISTEFIEDFNEQATKDALSGGNLSSAPSDSLFYVDKSQDLSVKRKIEKHRGKMLRCDSIMQKNPFVQAVPSSKPKSKKKQKVVGKAIETAAVGQKDDSATDSGIVDLWRNEDESKNKKDRKVWKPSSLIPAVEVEPPGCSYNPTSESHQDMLAEAVAQEMQKVYKNELGPEPVPLTVPGEAIDEADRYLLDVDDASDDDDDDDETNMENEDGVSEKRSSQKRRVTQVVLNKRARRKELEKKKAEENKVEELSKEIDGVSEILQEIAKEDKERERKHLRRVTAKQDRLKVCPPRLGKHKFEPAPVQVLLTEEITGSLRKLKACCTLARDRYKSLEKRGILVPSKKRRN